MWCELTSGVFVNLDSGYILIPPGQVFTDDDRLEMIDVVQTFSVKYAQKKAADMELAKLRAIKRSL